ncbi:MAG: hypothetical protein LQ347_003556 [Umbilicaria vellea]|nr:MAG: hypothetical protein LQ347_003556 [Umbilicaria vellea]
MGSSWANTGQNLAQFVRTHEKALANALQLRKQGPKHGPSISASGEVSPIHINNYQNPAPTHSTSSVLASAFSLGSLNFASQNIKPAKLTLTPHHLFYLLSRVEELGIAIGPMNVRLENIHADNSPANYVSFLSQSQRSKGRSDRDSIHSVSSVRSVMSGMSALWSNFGMGSSGNVAKVEKAKAQMVADLKYLYSAFTKIPCLRLSPDRRARLIGGYEEFPFDTAVPLLAFKNLSALEICDVDFRQFFGWDRLAEQLRSLTVKRASLEDPTDLLIGIVLDDMDKRRRRSSKVQYSPGLAWPGSPIMRHGDLVRPNSIPNSPVVDDEFGQSSSPRNSLLLRGDSEGPKATQRARTESTSPKRPTSSRQGSSNRRGGARMKRSGSASSNSSTHSSGPYKSGSSSNLLSMGILPASKWRFLRHLSLADNSLTSMTTTSLAPLANTLHSLDLSANLFSEVPDCLAMMTSLRALNLSNCMIESLHSLARNPLPAITALNLRANRFGSIAGVERLLSLERLDLRDNKLADPTEMARLTGIPNIHEIWVASNPFVKTHSNYRVTILNLFRSTPGYVEDIVIDAAGPGYSERRQLIDRVLEPEGVPVVRQPMESSLQSRSDLKDLVIPLGGDDELKRDEIHKSNFRVAQGEVPVGSGRRRKGPRRRIVDLSGTESTPPVRAHVPIDIAPAPPQREVRDGTIETGLDRGSPPAKTALQPMLLDESDSPVKPPKLGTSLSSPDVNSTSGRVDRSTSLASDLQNLNVSGEAYRRKIEALKSEVGNGWLSVLSEDGWDGQRMPRATVPSSNFNHINAIRPGMSNLRATSQGIVSGSRTLG